MKKRMYLVLMVLTFFLVLQGYREFSSPGLPIAKKAGDTVLPVDGTSAAGEKDTLLRDRIKVVTGEPLEMDNKDAQNVDASKDKPGAVALKVQY